MSKLILGYGLLGKEMVNQTGWEYKCRKDGFDLLECNLEDEILNYIDLPHEGRVGYSHPNTIINCVGNTDTYSSDKKSHWDINYAAVSKLVDFCNKYNIKLVHISTDYVYANSKGGRSEEDIPVHNEDWYSYTKLLADGYIELKSKNYLIIRPGHKPNPFPYDKAWVNQLGNFDYVETICEQMVGLINKDKNGIYNIGTEMKSMYDLAIKTKPNVKEGFKPNHIPVDVTMDISKFKKTI